MLASETSKVVQQDLAYFGERWPFLALDVLQAERTNEDGSSLRPALRVNQHSALT